ncbi:unnamed protein product [Prorocentrum cordatum]|uniref:Uncharacterized protein n=1 Tax=Prorocentrum cordatum TaxID=2364126 RepID=A0ABN9SR02_9DINO|nr:unnamed protein product [Polarella glacialis]
MKRRKGTDVNCWRSARISWCAGTPPAGARSAPGAAPGPSADPRNARGAPQVSARGDLSSSILGAEQNGGALPARCGARAACGRAPVWDAAARGTDGGEDEAEDQQRHAPPGGSSSRRGQEGEEEEGEEVEGASGKGSERMTACTIAVRELGCSRENPTSRYTCDSLPSDSAPSSAFAINAARRGAASETLHRWSPWLRAS